MLIPHDFYSEKKWCPKCRKYVPYLVSLEKCYCARCGHPVTLFSEEDKKKFKKALDKKRAVHRAS